MTGIPVHVVCGLPGSGKSALIHRLSAERRTWLGLVNKVEGSRDPMLRRVPSGCPCCTGRVAMQVELARALREARPERVLIEVLSGEHVDRVERALRDEPLGRYLSIGHRLILPRDVALSADALERS